jgi:glycosyltransferase involved in cell wall biosynthesis
MKVLLISALYPPMMLGGAENSARNLAEWLVTQGIEVAVVRATDKDESEGFEINPAGVQIYRIKTAHLYAPFRFHSAAQWQKPLWHLQDHFDSRIGLKIGRVLDEFAPDLVNVHMIQGIGYPALRELAKRQIPVNFVLPDLGLACIRMSMFKNGKDCPGHCTLCHASTVYKRGIIRKIARLGFVSPSRSNLETLSRYFPIKDYPHAIILNPNAYPEPTWTRTQSPVLRLLYAGRIHASKGVDLLLEAVEQLSRTAQVHLTLAGGGPQEAELRQRHGHASWCTFTGFIPQQSLADLMVNSDLLCIPSIWAENSPGVVVQALGLGLPVMGSNRGGIPELVTDGFNGRILQQQTVEAWHEALCKVAGNQEPIELWRANASSMAVNFRQDAIGHKVLEWMQHIAE